MEFFLRKLRNGSIVATVIHDENEAWIQDQNEAYTEPSAHVQGEADPRGAMLYVCAVIFLYGFSIILMIGSSARKKATPTDKSYLEDMYKDLKRAEKQQEKQKTKREMQRQKRSASFALGETQLPIATFAANFATAMGRSSSRSPERRASSVSTSQLDDIRSASVRKFWDGSKWSVTSDIGQQGEEPSRLGPPRAPCALSPGHDSLLVSVPVIKVELPSPTEPGETSLLLGE